MTNEVNVDKLASLFPNVITESRDENGNLKRAVNFDLLRSFLGDDVIIGETYEFNWIGKRSAIADAGRHSEKILCPCPEESKNWDNTKNYYIEGDNLDVLKLLQDSYFSRIKMIFIDPPYNTRNDFVYGNNFTKDRDGNYLFCSNLNNARSHSDWCSMIYSRLLLARDLLRDDGVIFIGIDDIESAQLRKICDETFGEGNFITQLVWEKGFTPKKDATRYVSNHHSYFVMFAKNITQFLKGLLSEKENMRFSSFLLVIKKYSLVAVISLTKDNKIDAYAVLCELCSILLGEYKINTRKEPKGKITEIEKKPYLLNTQRGLQAYITVVCRIFA
jgi:adenine-specific DNA-methyltransferase